jgi:hypothetical protein
MSKAANRPAIHYTVRGIPPDVDQALRAAAAKRKQSLNRVILDELARAVGVNTPKADFSDLVGKWKHDPGFDEIIASQRRIDPAKWK